MTLKELLATLARIAGRPAPRLRLPHWVPLAIAHVEAPIARLLGRAPRVPLDGVRMATKPMFFDGGKAVRELGIAAEPDRTGPAAGGRVVPQRGPNGVTPRSTGEARLARCLRCTPRSPRAASTSAQARTRWRSARSWGKADGCAKSRTASCSARIAPPSSRQRLRSGGSASAAPSLIARRISQGRPRAAAAAANAADSRSTAASRPGSRAGGERQQALLVGDGGGEARDRDQGRRARARQPRGPGEPRRRRLPRVAVLAHHPVRHQQLARRQLRRQRARDADRDHDARAHAAEHGGRAALARCGRRRRSPPEPRRVPASARARRRRRPASTGRTSASIARSGRDLVGQGGQHDRVDRVVRRRAARDHAFTP